MSLSFALVLESSQEERGGDWLRRKRGVFQSGEESQGRLVKEWTKRQSKSESGLAAVRARVS